MQGAIRGWAYFGDSVAAHSQALGEGGADQAHIRLDLGALGLDAPRPGESGAAISTRQAAQLLTRAGRILLLAAELVERADAAAPDPGLACAICFEPFHTGFSVAFLPARTERSPAGEPPVAGGAVADLVDA